MYNAIAIEQLGTPTAVLTNSSFVGDARSTAAAKGMPDVRIVSEPIACESTVLEDHESGITAVFDDIIAALSSPLQAASVGEAAPRLQAADRHVFEGSLEEVQRFFYRRGWTDGLPIIPPTEEAVAEMLTGTDLPPDHIVAKIIPRLGKATVEKIAINAVMAGALPTYMPLLIAAVQAVMEYGTRFDTFEVSTGSWAPFFIINGPVRRDINLNCSTGALSPGDMANAAFGRAMGLIIKNIGGARKGVEDMGTLGNPAKYSMVLGENEEESPWDPFHVDQGFDRGDSTISVFFPQTYDQTMTYGTDAEAIVSTMAYNVKAGHYPSGFASFLLIPSLAKILAEEGWSKDDVKAHISENAIVPFHKNARYWPVLNVRRERRMPYNPQDPIRLMPDLENIKVIVTGGPGAWIGLATGARITGQKWVSKKVELPTKWSELVARYRGIVPTYGAG